MPLRGKYPEFSSTKQKASKKLSGGNCGGRRGFPLHSGN